MKTVRLGSKKFVLLAAALFVALLVIGVMTKGCSSDGSSNNIFVEAPGEPANFLVVATPAGGDLSATLSWSAPTTGGETTSYEIYRSNSADNIFNPDNHLLSLPATTFEFIDNAGLERGVTTYWIVAARNAGGETPAALPGEYTPPGSGGGEVEGYGNNFAGALIFADGYGISGQEITGSWTNVVENIDYNTGMRPVIEENASELPYFDENTTFLLGGVTYYKQKTASTWQGEWENGAGTPQHVIAKWGDNLISQTLTTESIVRVEMVLSKALVDTNMTSYNMVSLYGTKEVEVYGTDGTTYDNNTSFVFATNARLTIHQLDENNNTIAVVEDQALFSAIPDGPGKFAAEITVAGNLAYGYVWDLKQNPVPAGTYRITFLLDGSSPLNGSVLNNTFIDDIGLPDEGDPSTFPVLVSDTEVYIDIIIH
jgi:hypothetical protein